MSQDGSLADLRRKVDAFVAARRLQRQAAAGEHEEFSAAIGPAVALEPIVPAQDGPPFADHMQRLAGLLRSRVQLDPLDVPVLADPSPALRQTCGARTRAGHACRRETKPGRRCRNHGGASTGPVTAEGRAKIAAAQRLRWARWRADRGPARQPAAT